MAPRTAQSFPVEERVDASNGAGFGLCDVMNKHAASATATATASMNMNIDTIPHAYPLNPNAANNAEFAFQEMLNNFTSQLQQQQQGQTDTPTPNSTMRQASLASSSSKATPESATLVDPMPMLFDMPTDQDQFADFANGKGHTMLGYMPQQGNYHTQG